MAIEKYMHHMPQIAEQVFLHASAQVIGEVSIGKDSSVWCNVVLRGDAK